MKNPCRNCPKKGCGAYHDICKEHQKWHEWDLAMKRQEPKEKQSQPTTKFALTWMRRGKI